MGVYGTSTFFQGDAVTPDAHSAPSSSSCATTDGLGIGLAASIPSQTSDSRLVSSSGLATQDPTTLGLAASTAVSSDSTTSQIAAPTTQAAGAASTSGTATPFTTIKAEDVHYRTGAYSAANGVSLSLRSFAIVLAMMALTPLV